MKLQIILCATLFLGLNVATCVAFPSLPGYLKDGYQNQDGYKPFLETVQGLETKCDICHKPGADKKAPGHGLNDFGKVFHDRFKHRDFTAADKAKNTEEAMKVFKEAWEKSVKEKNADGVEFIELIKAGKLPGKNN